MKGEAHVGSLEERRQHARIIVQWRITYCNEELFGQGTLLDVSSQGCHVAGTMPVAEGMLLKVRIFPLHREDELSVTEARVLWANGHVFGLRLRNISGDDQRWLGSFLENAERRHKFRQTFQPANQKNMAAMPLALPIKDC
jgi:PilZ domain